MCAFPEVARGPCRAGRSYAASVNLALRRLMKNQKITMTCFEDLTLIQPINYSRQQRKCRTSPTMDLSLKICDLLE
jgi:hypothetical protein